MKLTHKQKIKLARSLMTPREIKQGISIFQSVGWWVRGERIKIRVKKSIEKARELKTA